MHYDSGKADMSVAEVIVAWPEFMKRVKSLAESKGVQEGDIKIVSPSIEPTAAGFDWAVDFFHEIEQNGYRVDVLNVHTYTTIVGVPGGLCYSD